MNDSDKCDNKFVDEGTVIGEKATSRDPDSDNGAGNQTKAQERVRTVLTIPRGKFESKLEGKLSSQSLRRMCSIDHFQFATTEELPHVREIIGQPRAVRAIEFGIDIDSPGYNIFMLGPPGTGRATAVRQFLERRAKEVDTPHDWLYVYNFKVPHKPRALMLPAGMGAKIRDALAELVTELRRQIPLMLNTEQNRQAVDKIEHDLQQRRKAIMQKVLKMAADRQLAIVHAPEGLVVAPTANGQPIAPEAFAQLPERQRRAFEEQILAIQHELEEATRAMYTIEKETRQAKHTMEANSATTMLDLQLTEIRELCADNQKAQLWLDELRKDILDNLENFKTEHSKKKKAASDLPAVPVHLQQADSADIRFRRYQVNLFVNQSDSEGAPVVLEDLTTYKNLVGYIESEVHTGGAMSADFTMIKPGALHQANGGYLVIHALDILKQPFAWEALKRTLSSSVIRIEDPESRNRAGVLFPQMPAPEPIPISVKVVMLGTSELYYSLQSTDNEFPELFKVKADFATNMERNHENEHQYALFVAARCHEGHLPHFDKSGVAKIVEYGSWLAEDQDKLSTRFGVIADLIHEAAHWARRSGKDLVSAVDVQQAIKERAYRANLVEHEYRQRILEGALFIDTEGEVVGQVNGLTVLSSGDHAFGQPCRVTARIYLGDEGVINIEREVELAGPIHNKGLLTLRGYLGGQYALEHPLSLTASLTFEQNYGGIEGDSASTTELYALLSALSGYPIRQDIAVTGSVNQVGQVQPIGGVNQKIEGFYEVCKARGLNGTQGVIIPASNVKNLMLREEVLSALEYGLFHIYAVNTIDQGIEILTGIPVGERSLDSTFPEGTLHHAVKARLQELAETLQRYAGCQPGQRN
jgi:lon-related putative ATP-dependent protease